MSEEPAPRLTETPVGQSYYPKLDVFERLAKIFAIVAIPVVIPIALAIYSAKVQSAAQTETVNRDYVQLAVSILKEKNNGLDPGIRDWAVDLLAADSPIKFKPEVLAGLRSGAVSLPSLSSVAVGSQALSPDGKLLARADSLGIQVLDTASQARKFMFEVQSSVNALDFSADSSFLAAGCQDGATLIYRTDVGSLYVSFKIDHPVTQVRFDPLGEIQIGSNGGIWTYGVKTGQLIRKISPPNSPTNLTGTQR